MLLFTHPTGNSNVRHAALGLYHSGLLEEFLTCLDFHPSPAWQKLLPGSLLRQLQRRSYTEELSPTIRLQPAREIARLIASRFGLTGLIRHEHGPWSIDAVYRSLDETASRRLQ